jgi:hypothetical protein
MNRKQEIRLGLIALAALFLLGFGSAHFGIVSHTYNAKAYCPLAEDGVTDDAAALNACILRVGNSGGGVLLFAGSVAQSVTIDNQHWNVTLQGYGSDISHNVGNQLAGCSATFKWIGANGGIQVWFHSPEDVNGQKRSGGGVQGMCFNSGQTTPNTGAYYGIRLSSWNKATISGNFFYQEQVAGILMDVVTDLFDPRDDQGNVIESNDSSNYSSAQKNDYGGLLVLQGDVNNPAGGNGGTGRSANVSLNTFRNNTALIKNGIGFDIYDTDHNSLYESRSLVYPGGTGAGMVLECTNGTAGAARKNYIAGWSGAFIARGTVSCATPSTNNYLDMFDDANGSSYTIEPGASITCGYKTNGTIGSCTTGDLKRRR